MAQTNDFGRLIGLPMMFTVMSVNGKQLANYGGRIEDVRQATQDGAQWSVKIYCPHLLARYEEQDTWRLTYSELTRFANGGMIERYNGTWLIWASERK